MVGHDDDRAVELNQKDESWDGRLKKGASLIQTDRPVQLLQYLKERADDEKDRYICCLGLLFSLCSYTQVQREYHLISAEKIENKYIILQLCCVNLVK